jgi:predicted nucleic acid-binding protein
VILVDTSVWIEFFNGIGSGVVHLFEELIEAEEEVCISEYILTEVLQGFKNDRDFELARKHLLQFPIYSLKGMHSYIQASQIYRRCRKEGITVRKTADCIIAQTAIENRLILLHDDADFDRIALVCPLRIFKNRNRAGL